MSEPELVRVNLGTVTSYGIALENGFTGTQAEWTQKIINGASQADLDALAADVYYTALAINTFSVSPNVAEMGSTVTAAALTFAMNKIPNVMTLDGVTQTPAKTGTINQTGLTLTENKTWTLHAEDNGSPTHAKSTPTKTATLEFMNRAHYGAAAEPGPSDSWRTFLLGLDYDPLTETRERTINSKSIEVNAGAGEYIWYAVPKRLGACSFKVGDFSGGFDPAVEVSLMNESGFTETYYVYHSTESGLGSPEITVK